MSKVDASREKTNFEQTGKLHLRRTTGVEIAKNTKNHEFEGSLLPRNRFFSNFIIFNLQKTLKSKIF